MLSLNAASPFVSSLVLTFEHCAMAEKRRLLDSSEASPGFSAIADGLGSSQPAQLGSAQSQLEADANVAEPDAERGTTPGSDNAVGRALLAPAVENVTGVVSANVTTVETNASQVLSTRSPVSLCYSTFARYGSG